MSVQDKKFNTKDELEDWLKRRGVDEDDVGDAADKLFAGKFNKPSNLLGITIPELNKYAGIEGPVARGLVNKLKDEAENKQQQQGVAFVVEAIVQGAVRSNGARGNVFKCVEKHRGYFSKEEGIQIMYDGEDLSVKVYFEEKGDACDFQTN